MLPSRAQRIRDRTIVAVDSVFAEPVKFAPMNKGSVDQDRAVVTIEGVLRAGGGKETNLAGGMASSWRTRLAAGKSELHIGRTRYPDLVVKIGDAVQALSRPGEPWFEVLRVDDRGDGRLVLELGEK